MFFERFDRVRRARRIIPARAAEDGREHDLVRPHAEDERGARQLPPPRSVVTGHSSPESPEELLHGLLHFCVQRRVLPAVRRREDPHDEVEWRVRLHEGEHVKAYDLAEAAFHEVPLDAGVLVFRDHEADPGKRLKGSGGAHVQ